MDDKTLASELIAEIKRISRRWFILFLTVLGLWTATIGGWVWYATLPTEETAEIYNEDGNANYVGNDLNGVINNGENKGN